VVQEHNARCELPVAAKLRRLGTEQTMLLHGDSVAKQFAKTILLRRTVISRTLE
jgi:hypothetical protein